MSDPTLAGVLAGFLAAAVLARLRVRPDHRLRCLIDVADPDGGPRFVPPGWSALRRIATTRSGRHRRSPGPAELAGWCDTLTRDLRSGATLAFALRSRPAPDGSAFVDVPRRLGRGVPLAEAVRLTGGSADEQAVATVLMACAVSGGPVAEPLDRVAATLRRRAADAAERQVHSAQARLSAQVMTVIPVAVLLLLLTTSPTVRHGLGTPAGFTTVAFGLVLNAVGWRWMRRVIGGRR